MSKRTSARKEYQKAKEELVKAFNKLLEKIIDEVFK